MFSACIASIKTNCVVREHEPSTFSLGYLTMSFPEPPPGSIGLTIAFETRDENYGVIGVCTDFLPITRSGGTDHTIKFTLHDPGWLSGYGMDFRFFRKEESQLPQIRDPGDILIIKNVKTKDLKGFTVGLSNGSTNWIVLAGRSVLDSTCPQGSDITMHASSRRGLKPTKTELQYAKAIAAMEDSGLWPKPAPVTSFQAATTTKADGTSSGAPKERFRLIEDIGRPDNTLGYTFVDILGEVRRIFDNDSRLEISITDYTSNKDLYEYKSAHSEDGYDGDKFGHIVPQKKWPGPWGKMIMMITLWDENADFARKEVQEGKFVFLRNVQIKFDRTGHKLEGHCRGDRNRSRVNVSVLKKHEKDGNERYKALLQRKRDYESAAKIEGLSFHTLTHQKRSCEESREERKAKKSKNKLRGREKNRLRAENKSEQPVQAKQTQDITSNVNVRCQSHDVPLTSIRDILDGDRLRRSSPKGVQFYVPFQNCRYKTNVRVVDYFPPDIADFAVPRHDFDHEMLSDQSDFDSDPEIYSQDNRRLTWEWRFFLLVEDAQSPPLAKGESPKRMELLVADTDGQYLLNMDACDLRDPKNKMQLNKLKDLKLCHLWGDLQERKEESSATEGISVKSSGRPFECFVKEYGVAIEGVGSGSSDNVEYERMFRLFGTTV